MPVFNLPPFGEINFKSVEDSYDCVTDLKSMKISLDLNFENGKTTEKKLEVVKFMLENLEKMDDLNKKYIQDDFKDENEEVTKDYVDFHIDELENEQLSFLIDLNSSETEKRQQLLNKLHLVRVGFYPDCKEHFAVFDYTIGNDITDQLVVINVDIKSKIHCMSQES